MTTGRLGSIVCAVARRRSGHRAVGRSTTTGSRRGRRPGTVVGLGIDAVDVERMARVLARRPGVAERSFRRSEREAGRGAEPARLAARFAAKEATLKALGLGLAGAPLTDIEVVTAPSGAPGLRLHGRALTAATNRAVRDWKISMSHTDTTAVAVVVALT